MEEGKGKTEEKIQAVEEVRDFPFPEGEEAVPAVHARRQSICSPFLYPAFLCRDNGREPNRKRENPLFFFSGQLYMQPKVHCGGNTPQAPSLEPGVGYVKGSRASGGGVPARGEAG